MRLNNSIAEAIDNSPSLILSFVLIMSIIFLAILSFGANYFFLHFHGNDYYPPNTILIGTILLCMALGCRLCFHKQSIYFLIMRELFYYFFVMSIIILATNAAQYTPFPPIDEKIINLGSRWLPSMPVILAWTAHHHWFKTILQFAYDSLPTQMALLPFIIIAMRKFNVMHEYYCLLLITTLVGFSFYYFLPTMGPAAFIKSPHFTYFQYATGIKFKEIHYYLTPSTIEGGLIAFPSFHVIWAWCCLYLIRCLPKLLILVLPINLLLAISCVLLGWHYPLDVVGSLLLILLIFYFYRRAIFIIREKQQPQTNSHQTI